MPRATCHVPHARSQVCIFAYGQTGSGKTFTMEGGDGEARGVVPRAAEQVFGAARELSLLGWTFEFHASFLEIYNDELRDLLPVDGGAAAAPAKLKISDANGVVAVPGLRSARVENTQQLEALMHAASKVRSRHMPYAHAHAACRVHMPHAHAACPCPCTFHISHET